VLGRLGRLEEHVGVAVAVKLGRGVARRLDVVALLEVRLADGLDRVRPLGLALEHLELGHDVVVGHGRGRRRGSRRVRHGRVVEEDAGLAVLVALVAEGVLYAHLVTGGRARKDVVAHCDRQVAVEVDLVVAEDHVRPALAAVDREARVLALVLVHVHGVGAHKVRHRHLARRAERVLGRLGRLEEHVGVAVAVKLGRGVARRLDVVALLLVRLADGLDRVRPLGLELYHLGLGDRGSLGRRAQDLVHLEVEEHDAVGTIEDLELLLLGEGRRPEKDWRSRT